MLLRIEMEDGIQKVIVDTQKEPLDYFYLFLDGTSTLDGFGNDSGSYTGDIITMTN